MGNNIVTKNFIVHDREEQQHTVQIRHGVLSGYREIRVDGIRRYKNVMFVDTGEKISTKISNDEKIEVEIRLAGHSFTYLVRTEAGVEQKLCHLSSGISDDDIKLNIRVTIPSHSIITVDDEDKIAFNIEGTVNGDEVKLSKRFSDFSELNDQIRSAYADNHLLENIPEFPSKYMSFFTDHFDETFLRKRRVQLEYYLQRLVRVPKVASNPDLVHFFLPPTQPTFEDFETSVIYPKKLTADRPYYTSEDDSDNEKPPTIIHTTAPVSPPEASASSDSKNDNSNHDSATTNTASSTSSSSSSSSSSSTSLPPSNNEDPATTEYTDVEI